MTNKYLVRPHVIFGITLELVFAQMPPMATFANSPQLSMVRAKLKNNNFFLTSITQFIKAHTYLKWPKSASIEIPSPLSDPNLFSKRTSKCEYCGTVFENFMK